MSRAPKRRRRSASDAAAYEFIEQLRRDLRSRDPHVRERARQTKAESDRLDREIALVLAQKRR